MRVVRARSDGMYATLLGAGLGIVVSFLYPIILIAVNLILMAQPFKTLKEVTGLLSFSAYWGAMCGFWFTLVPYTLIGAGTGLIIETVVARYYNILSSRKAFWIGFAVSLCIACVVSIIWLAVQWRSAITRSNISALLSYFIVIPSAIYTITSGWVGRRLYLKKSTTRTR